MTKPTDSGRRGSTLLNLLITLVVVLVTAGVMAVVLRGGNLSDLRDIADKLINQQPGISQTQPGAGDSVSAGGIGGTGYPSPDPSTLTVAPEGSKSGYGRAQFGQAWTDDVTVDGGRNGCDTRNDILRRDLTAVTLSGRCKVLSGTLADPYTGTIISFVRGQETSAAVQIDHVVALGNVWVSGGSEWDNTKRAQIANDPLNLLAVDGSENASKGDKSADEWLPDNTAFHCAYVKRQVMVKNKYQLTVTPAEMETMQRFYGRC